MGMHGQHDTHCVREEYKMKWLKKLMVRLFNRDRDSIEKILASIDGVPWVKVTAMEVDKNDLTKGNFELDWNNAFIDELIAAGYSGRTNEEIIDQWFTTVCHSIASEIDTLR
jgi:hypothetical protein